MCSDYGWLKDLVLKSSLPQSSNIWRNVKFINHYKPCKQANKIILLSVSKHLSNYFFHFFNQASLIFILQLTLVNVYLPKTTNHPKTHLSFILIMKLLLPPEYWTDSLNYSAQSSDTVFKVCLS